MKKFRKLNLDESRDSFTLLSDEARKALKGGCDKCEVWAHWGLTIYSEADYQRMIGNGTWTSGVVCGLGYLLAEVDSYGQMYGKVVEVGGYCVLHQIFEDEWGHCKACDGDPSKPPQSQENNPNGYGYGYDYWGVNPDTGWQQDSTGGGSTGNVSGDGNRLFSSERFKKLYDTDSTLDKTEKAQLQNAMELIADMDAGKLVCDLLTSNEITIFFEVNENTKIVDGVHVPAQYTPSSDTIRFHDFDEITFDNACEELIHAIQDHVHGKNFINAYSNFEFEAKILKDMVTGMGDNKKNFSSGVKLDTYDDFVKKVSQGQYNISGVFDEIAFKSDFYTSCKNWSPKDYKGQCNEMLDPTILLEYAKNRPYKPQK